VKGASTHFDGMTEEIKIILLKGAAKVDEEIINLLIGGGINSNFSFVYIKLFVGNSL
jgi:hypothetical protein